RRRIAFLASLAITAVVTLGWVGALTTSGHLAIEPAGASNTPSLADTKTNFDQLLGAAGAAMGASSSPAAVTLVEGSSYSTLDMPQQNFNNTSQTVITF
ncbi:MAG: hypothetical protein AAB883_01530, partial [Patescibacteria group bacterium]